MKKKSVTKAKKGSSKKTPKKVVAKKRKNNVDALVKAFLKVYGSPVK
jgi:hypothetical protein